MGLWVAHTAHADGLGFARVQIARLGDALGSRMR